MGRTNWSVPGCPRTLRQHGLGSQDRQENVGGPMRLIPFLRNSHASCENIFVFSWSFFPILFFRCSPFFFLRLTIPHAPIGRMRRAQQDGADEKLIINPVVMGHGKSRSGFGQLNWTVVCQDIPFRSLHICTHRNLDFIYYLFLSSETRQKER